MLRVDLLRISYNRGLAKLLFIDERYNELVYEIASLFKVGKTIGDIKEEGKYLKKVYNPKLVDGILTIILRKVRVESSYPLDPRIIRSKLFSRGPATSEEEREKIIRSVFRELGFNPIKYIYSDLEEELEVVQVPPLRPIDIIKEYNAELLQTSLLKAVSLRIYTKQNWKEIIYVAKKLGLMYNAYSNPLYLEVFGPASLLKLTERYGRSMAMLLPYIMKDPGWEVEGEIVGKGSRTYLLKVSHKDATFPEVEGHGMRFDSYIEKEFYSKLKVIAKEWSIEREPEPIVVENSVFIPDFAVKKGRIKVYIEIVGFWTKEYLKRKEEKVRNLSVPLLLIVDESLGYGGIEGSNVIKFRKSINMAAVYIWLKNYFGKVERGDKRVKLEGEVIPINEVPNYYNGFQNGSINDYIKLKRYLIKKKLFNSLKDKDYDGMRLSDLLEKYGDYIVDLLEYLGYKIRWINVTEAVVKKA